MSKIISFVKLDFMTIKAYLNAKQLSVLLTTVALVSFTEVNASGIIMTFAFMGSLYPFIIGEKNNLDQLYCTLPMNKRNIVLGRYAFVLAFDVIALLVSTILSIALPIILQKPIHLQEQLLVNLILFLLVVFLQAIQLPIYFKLGYAKAKFMANLPFLLFLLAVILSSTFLGTLHPMVDLFINVFLWISMHQLLTFILVTIVWAVALFASYKISLRFYQKRGF